MAAVQELSRSEALSKRSDLLPVPKTDQVPPFLDLGTKAELPSPLPQLKLR